MAQMICPRCGHVNPDTVTRCEQCYKKLDDVKTKNPSETPKSPGTLLTSGKKPPPPPSTPTLPIVGTSSGSGGKKAIVSTKSGASGLGGGHLSPSVPGASSIVFPGSSPKPLRPIPAHMLKYGTPKLEGFVRDLREMQLDRPLSMMDFAGDAILAIFEPKWAIFSAVTKLTRRDKNTAYAIQVEQASGMIQVALIQGGKGIPPEIGEYVSIWGQEKKGIILIQSLFNHITGSEI